MNEIDLLRRQLNREKSARKEAEKIAEQKTREIYYINQELRQLNDHLEEMVKERTAELAKARDEAIEANRIKSQFLANMSHELRTPLNAIIGYSEILLEEAEELGEQTLVDDLEKINKSGKHLLSLINDILDISKIEAGKMDLYYEVCDIPGLIQEVMLTIKPLVEKNGNRFENYCEAGEMKTDVTKLRQILFNLLSNACKFTKEGTIEITAIHDIKAGTPGVTFNIKDTGIGMSPGQMGKLFQSFTQADSSTTRKYGGTGLGLAISQRFCQMMGGEIGVDSTLGQGSTFTFWLPVAGVEQQAENAIARKMEEMREGKGTILFIDDDPSMLQLMQHFLGNDGWNMVHAQSGQEGLRLAREQQPGVICLDILMPGMDGWTVLTTLKSDPALAHIPVIILSMTDDKSLGYALGASEFLTKPVHREELISVLDKYIMDRSNSDILVIEDDATTSEMMTKLLKKAGYSSTLAGNGRIALDCMAQTIPQLILLDLMMPEMDGFQFVLELRKSEAWKNIPVIVVTAKTLTAEDRLRLNGSVEKIIQKGSFNRESLLTEVRRMITSSIDRSAEQGGNDPRHGSVTIEEAGCVQDSSGGR